MPRRWDTSIQIPALPTAPCGRAQRALKQYTEAERKRKMKKFRRSPIAIACYVLAAIFTAYFLVVVVSTVTSITQYYASYQMSPTVSEIAGYLLQNGLAPLTAIITTFMAGLIYDEVRKLNPDNWATEDEIAEAKEARRQAKEAKQIAKGEAAVAAAAAAAEEAAEDTAEEIKPEFSAVVVEEAEAAAEAAAEEAEAAVEEEAEDITEQEEVTADEEEQEETAEPEHTEFFAEVAEEEAAEEIKEEADTAEEIKEEDAAADAE